jgi:predicted DNA-binding ribbon-helix-helix protein
MGSSIFQTRNINLNGRRTSVRLERELWEAVGELCSRENLSVHQLCENVQRMRHGMGLTGALRLHLFRYYRAAATEEGHRRSGHGVRLSRLGVAATA